MHSTRSHSGMQTSVILSHFSIVIARGFFEAISLLHCHCESRILHPVRDVFCEAIPTFNVALYLYITSQLSRPPATVLVRRAEGALAGAVPAGAGEAGIGIGIREVVPGGHGAQLQVDAI